MPTRKIANTTAATPSSTSASPSTVVWMGSGAFTCAHRGLPYATADCCTMAFLQFLCRHSCLATSVQRYRSAGFWACGNVYKQMQGGPAEDACLKATWVLFELALLLTEKTRLRVNFDACPTSLSSWTAATGSVAAAIRVSQNVLTCSRKFPGERRSLVL